MLNVKPQKIFVSIDDSVPYVLDLINTVLTSRIILVIEENAGIISSPVSLKVLMRELSKANRVVIIQTRDRKAKKFGEIVGFVVVQETSEITEDLWKDSEQGVDAFKNIYAERKQALHKRRNEVGNVTRLSDNLSTGGFESSLDLHEENMESPDANEVVDIPIVESRLQTGFFSKSSKIKPQEKIVNEEPHPVESKAQEQLVKNIPSKPIPQPQPKPEVKKEPIAEKKELISETPKSELAKPEPVQNIVEVEAPKVKRMSFEELYRQTKERNSLNKKVEPVAEIKQEPKLAPIVEFVPPPPVYKRYVPKLIRTSGLVIAPGGDLRGFEEIAPEIVKDELTIQAEINKKHNASVIRNEVPVSKTENTNVQKIDREGHDQIQQRPVYNTRESQPQKIIRKNQKSIFSNFKPSKEKIAEMQNILKSSTTALGGLLQNSIQKVKSLKNSTAPKPRSRFQQTRQQIPRDPLKRNDGYKQPESRLVNRKLIKNGIRSVIIFLVVFGGVSYLFLKYGTKAEVTFALTPIVISATKNITLKTSLEADAGADSKVLGTQDSLQVETLSYSLDQGMSIDTTATIDQGKESTGSLTVYNKTDKDISLPAGTKFKIVIAKKELNFLLVGNVTIPKRIIKTIRTDNGFADVRVVAEKKGADYNVPSELLGEQNRFSVSGYETSVIEAISYLGFSGGTTKIVKVVSQDDHKNLKTTLEAKLHEQIQAFLQTTYSTDYDIVSKDVKFDILKEEYNGQVDQVADKVDLYMKVEGKILGVKKKMIEQTINSFYEATKQEKLAGKSGKYLMPVNEKWDHKYSIVSADDNQVVVKLDIDGKLIPPVDVESLKSKLIGLKYSESENIFAQYTDITEKSLNISPNIVPESLRYFPQNVDAINIVFEKLDL